ncbi:arginine/serine-rich protein 1-like [Prunus persica]|uniref:arginine/serine-rich protein 1-like n=1 Tax=Prunus persica TaxID=3760 RepID=UPI0009AB4ACF|nr:arginine/serine-rich protein 1-like [Prunus persica]
MLCCFLGFFISFFGVFFQCNNLIWLLLFFVPVLSSVVILRKVKVRFVQKFFCFSRFMFLVVWPWFLIRSDLNCIPRSYTPSFSWSSPSSSSPSSSLPSSPSSVWRCSSSSRSPQRSPQRSDVDNPMNNLHGRRGRTPISGRGHQTIPLHHRTPSYSPPRRSRMYSNHRRHYSRSPSYSSDLSRRRSYSPHYSRRRASPSYNRRRAISLLQSAAQNILCSVQSV